MVVGVEFQQSRVEMNLVPTAFQDGAFEIVVRLIRSRLLARFRQVAGWLAHDYSDAAGALLEASFPRGLDEGPQGFRQLAKIGWTNPCGGYGRGTVGIQRSTPGGAQQ